MLPFKFLYVFHNLKKKIVHTIFYRQSNHDDVTLNILKNKSSLEIQTKDSVSLVIIYTTIAKELFVDIDTKSLKM